MNDGAAEAAGPGLRLPPMLRFGSALLGALLLAAPLYAQDTEDPPVPEWARTPLADQAPANQAPANAPPAAAPAEASAEVDASAASDSPAVLVERLEDGRPRYVPATTDWPAPGGVFRGLPPCEVGAMIPNRATGEPYTCHPPFRDPGNEVLFHLQMGPGVALDGVDTERSFAGGFDLSVFPFRSFGIGAEWMAIRARQTGHDLDGDGFFDVRAPHLRLHAFTGRLVFRHYLNDSNRRSIGFFAQGGYGVSITDRVPNMPLVGGGLVLSAGTTGSSHIAADIELGLRYLQGLGDGSEFRTVLLTFGVGMGSRIHAPRDFSTPRRGGPFRFSLAIVAGSQIRTGGMFTGEVTLGLDVHPLLEPRLRAELGGLITEDALGEDEAPFTRALLGSLGLRVYAPLRVPIFGELGAGVASFFGDTPRNAEPGAFVDLRFGVPFLGCGGGGNVTLRYRAGVSHGYRGEHYIGAAFEVAFGNYRHLRAYSRNVPLEQACPAPSAGRNPLPPAPPPPPAPPEPESVQGGASGSVGVDVEVEIPQVEIEIEPVTVEVVIGYVLFGGAVDIRLNVASLPLAQLRQAGWVEVEIVGPPAARARARAELNAVLSREGVTVNAEAEADASGAVQQVKAIFTIWPNGSRPSEN
ncbi:MAG: hypothetical protein CMN30_11670 [Sandaracinus sp.]|nr:hypothetical protein [Sandaracinus sp.]